VGPHAQRERGWNWKSALRIALASPHARYIRMQLDMAMFGLAVA